MNRFNVVVSAAFSLYRASDDLLQPATSFSQTAMAVIVTAIAPDEIRKRTAPFRTEVRFVAFLGADLAPLAAHSEVTDVDDLR